jgi:hypothetical protein
MKKAMTMLSRTSYLMVFRKWQPVANHSKQHHRTNKTATQQTISDGSSYPSVGRIRNSQNGSSSTKKGGKKSAAVRVRSICSAHKLWTENSAVFDMWGGTLQHSQIFSNHTWRKIIKQVHKNLVFFQIDILTFLSKKLLSSIICIAVPK